MGNGIKHIVRDIVFKVKDGAFCCSSEKMEVLNNQQSERKEQDASQDYPQSCSKIQVFYIWNSTSR